MIQKILAAAVLGGMFGCVLGVLASVALAYLNQFRPGLANYQRDLWSLGAIFLAMLLGPVGGGIGVVLGALIVYLRARTHNVFPAKTD